MSSCHVGLVTATTLCNIVTWVCLNALSPDMGGQIPVELTENKRWKLHEKGFEGNRRLVKNN